MLHGVILRIGGAGKRVVPLTTSLCFLGAPRQTIRSIQSNFVLLCPFVPCCYPVGTSKRRGLKRVKKQLCAGTLLDMPRHAPLCAPLCPVGKEAFQVAPCICGAPCFNTRLMKIRAGCVQIKSAAPVPTLENIETNTRMSSPHRGAFIRRPAPSVR